MSAFGKLFGAKKKAEPEIDASATQLKLQDQVENIEMRIKKIENGAKDLK